MKNNGQTMNADVKVGRCESCEHIKFVVTLSNGFTVCGECL